MHHAVIFLVIAFVAGSLALPPMFFDHLPSQLGNHPGCSYNITPDQTFNGNQFSGTWYVDSIDTPQGDTDKVTCYRENFGYVPSGNGIGVLRVTIVFKASGAMITADGQANNFNYAHQAFFQGNITVHGNDVDQLFNYDVIFASTDYSEYALQYVCTQNGADSSTYSDQVAFLSRSADGLSDLRRASLLAEVAALGWNTALIKRIPTQTGCPH